jgi:hypothetical protein
VLTAQNATALSGAAGGNVTGSLGSFVQAAIAVLPAVPRERPLNRPVGTVAAQNAALPPRSARRLAGWPDNPYRI